MMTRDAKIGLLVVLAFCLIVGILLSEHVTGGASTAQASLAQAGPQARRATAAPAVVSPAALAATVIDADPQPKQSVVTRDQLDAPVAPAATAQIELGQPVAGEMKVIRVEAAPDAVAGAVQVAVPSESQVPEQPAKVEAVATNVEPPTIKPVQLSDSALQKLAKEQGLELVAVGADAKTSPKVAPQQPVAMASTPKSLAPAGKNIKVKEFVAQPGDTLSKMAGRMLGSNTPANRQAIVDLNPSLQKNPERILVGAKYLVPADAWAAALDVPAEPTPAAKPVAKAEATKPEAAKPVAAKAESTKAESKPVPAKSTKVEAKPVGIAYEVKSGDSLWKLAAGDANLVEQIKRMNADVLKGNDNVRVGMKLTLPAKKKS